MNSLTVLGKRGVKTNCYAANKHKWCGNCFDNLPLCDEEGEVFRRQCHKITLFSN